MNTVVLLVLSNVCMTVAWYGHVKTLNHRPLIAAILASWGIAFFEYRLQAPANRAGYGPCTLGQLKVLQEIMTMAVCAGCAVVSMRQPLTRDFLYAGSCLVAAAFFICRSAAWR